jgi:hypothetical protein
MVRDWQRDCEMFARCIEIFDRCYRLADEKKVHGFCAPLGVELRERLQQMNWLLTQIRSREDKLRSIDEKCGAALKAHIERITAEGLSYGLNPIPQEDLMSREGFYRYIALMAEIRLFAECFYYFAFRASRIIRNMPELKSFEAAGVRNMRNHLIEHPEARDSQVLSWSFGFGGPNGAVVKAIRESSETAHPDAGLYLNAREFAVNLETALERGIAGLASSSP